VGPVRRRRRWPFFVAVLVVVLAGILVGLDLAARSAAQSAAARQVKKSTGAATATVTFNSEPFLWDVLVDGRLSRVTVTAGEVPFGPITVTQVKVAGSDVRLDRNQLFNSRTVRVTSVRRATVTIVTRGGLLSAAAVAALDFTRIPLVPSCPLTAQAVNGGYDLTCTVSPVPASVLNAINAAA
jgi:hypothetical protein